MLEQEKHSPNFFVAFNFLFLDCPICHTPSFSVLCYFTWKPDLAIFLPLSISEPRIIQIPNFERNLPRSSLSITQNLDAFTVVVHEISTHKWRTDFVILLTLSISEPMLVQVPNFERKLPRSSLSITQNMDALAVVVHEISTHNWRTDLAIFLTLSISEPMIVQVPNFERKLRYSSLSITQNLDALAVVVHEISTHNWRTNLAIFLTLSISEPMIVQVPNFERKLWYSSLSITQNFDALAVVVHEISTDKQRTDLAIYLILSISEPSTV